MKLLFLPPRECTDKQLLHFRTLVLKGGQVQQGGLEGHIRHAEILAFVYDEQLVSVSALKNPDPRYRRRVFQKAAVDDLAALYPFETGCAFTESAYRGRRLHGDVLAGLLKEARGVYMQPPRPPMFRVSWRVSDFRGRGIHT